MSLTDMCARRHRQHSHAPDFWVIIWKARKVSTKIGTNTHTHKQSRRSLNQQPKGNPPEVGKWASLTEGEGGEDAIPIPAPFGVERGKMIRAIPF